MSAWFILDSTLNARILASPYYRALVRLRRQQAARQGTLLLVVNLGFIALATFASDFMALPLANGNITVGMLAGVGLIAFCIFVAYRYCRRAREFDALLDTLIRELKRCPR